MNSGDKRRMTVLVSILGVLVAVFFVKTFVLGGDDSSDNKSASGPSAQIGGDASTTATAAVPVPSTNPPVEFNVNAVRDPFEPAIPLPTDPTNTTDSSSTSGTGSTDSTETTKGDGTGSTGTTKDGTTGSQTTDTSTPDNNPPGTAVALLDVFIDTDGLPKATVQVAATVYDTLTQGDTFGPGGKYQIVTLDAQEGCGEFLFGDSPFRLCKGQQTVK